MTTIPFAEIPPSDNDISGAIIDAAIEVHKELGPGLLESVYRHCLAFELRLRGFKVDEERKVPVIYKGERIDLGFRLDLIVNDRVIVEVKASRPYIRSRGLKL